MRPSVLCRPRRQRRQGSARSSRLAARRQRKMAPRHRLQRVSVGPQGEDEAVAVVVAEEADRPLVAVVDHMLKIAGNSRHPLSHQIPLHLQACGPLHDFATALATETPTTRVCRPQRRTRQTEPRQPQPQRQGSIGRATRMRECTRKLGRCGRGSFTWVFWRHRRRRRCLRMAREALTASCCRRA